MPTFRTFRLIAASTIALCFSQSTFATWYTVTVKSVISRGDGVERPYILTLPAGQSTTPNPANCPGVWAGAAWASEGSSARTAAAIALTAKAMGSTVSVEISDTACFAGSPIMNWIIVQ